MKKILFLAVVAAAFAAFFVQWRMTGGAFARTATSSSQIYIHGTPVCVMKHGDGILAKVGNCGPGDPEEEEDGQSELPEGMPFHGSPGTALPPGHPPVTPDMTPEGPNRVAI